MYVCTSVLSTIHKTRATSYPIKSCRLSELRKWQDFFLHYLEVESQHLLRGTRYSNRATLVALIPLPWIPNWPPSPRVRLKRTQRIAKDGEVLAGIFTLLGWKQYNNVNIISDGTIIRHRKNREPQWRHKRREKEGKVKIKPPKITVESEKESKGPAGTAMTPAVHSAAPHRPVHQFAHHPQRPFYLGRWTLFRHSFVNLLISLFLPSVFSSRPVLWQKTRQ